MSSVYYISLPKEPESLPLLDYGNSEKKADLHHGINWNQNNYYNHYVYLPSDSAVDDDNMVFSEQLKAATFKHCFENPLVYHFSSGMIPGFREQFDEIVHGGLLDEKTKTLELGKLYDSLDCWRRQRLYNIVDSLLNVGEFVEILAVFTNHTDFNFGPPKLERTISLKDVLSLKNILRHPKYPDIMGGYKLTIVKGIPNT